MDDLNKTLKEFQHKLDNSTDSDRLKALDLLKNFISNLESTTRYIVEDGNKGAEENCNGTPQPPLKLTIRKSKSREINFACKECHKKFCTMQKLVSHVTTCHAASEVTCKTCKGTFHSYSLLRVHECFFSMQPVFVRRRCGICDKLFFQKREYHFHMKEKHMIEIIRRLKYFSCRHCNAIFKLRSQLLVHLSQKHKDYMSNSRSQGFQLKGRRIVPSVQRKTNSNSQFNKELNGCLPKRSKLTQKTWCSICKRSFLSQKALEKHCTSYNHKLKAGELNVMKKFICEICDKPFPKLSCLQRHLSSHQNDLAHKCALCDYQTAEKCNLNEHMRRHYQIRNFACEFCDAKFIANRELKDHIAFKHNTNRPFECKECGKMFKTRRILTRHTKTHSNIRPYICACGSDFLRLTNLRRHMVGVHHDSNPLITKIQISNNSCIDFHEDKPRDMWYADSNFIKQKKTTPITLNQSKLFSEKSVEVNANDGACHSTDIDGNLSLVSLNLIGDSNNNKKKRSIFPTSNSSHVITHGTSTLVENTLNCKDNSIQDPNTLDDSMNICDLVTSPSYPLLVTSDQSDESLTTSKLSYEISLKNENLGKYKVDSIIMEPESRNNLDGIWRPIDTVEQESTIIDDQTASLATTSLDIFPQNPSIISSFNEVFLSSVSNNCYSDDPTSWNNLSFSNSNTYNTGDTQNYIITGTMSACEPLSDNITVSDSIATTSENFLYYNNQQHITDRNSAQSFAYIEPYSSINIDHNYGNIHDNISTVSYSSIANNNSYQQNSSNIPQLHDQAFSLSYTSSTNNTSEFVPNQSNSCSISNILFSQDQLFTTNPSNFNNNGNHSQQAINNWLQHSPLNEFNNDTFSNSVLDSYKMSSVNISTATPSSSGVITSVTSNPPRILSPIDFLVTDTVFQSGIKSEFCFGIHELSNGNDLNVGLTENTLISDFCPQNHQHYTHSTAQLCSKNFSVVNLISTGCATQNNTNKDTDDLLYSDEPVI